MNAAITPKPNHTRQENVFRDRPNQCLTILFVKLNIPCQSGTSFFLHEYCDKNILCGVSKVITDSSDFADHQIKPSDLSWHQRDIVLGDSNTIEPRKNAT